MDLNEIFNKLLELSKSDRSIRTRLLATKNSPDYMYDFCAVANEYGVPVTIGDILTAGEENSCNQLKSTNGGGVNPYDYFDDPLEMFMVSLEQISEDVK